VSKYKRTGVGWSDSEYRSRGYLRRKELTPREIYVATERLRRTLKSVGESIGVQKERVRQIQAKAIRKMQDFPDENRDHLWIWEEQGRFDWAANNPHVTQKEPIWCVVLKNTRAAMDGVRLQSDAWSFRHDLSDIDLKDHEIIAKTRPVREKC